MKAWALPYFTQNNGIILGMGSVSERWRYNVTSSLIAWANTQNDPCGRNVILSSSNVEAVFGMATKYLALLQKYHQTIACIYDVIYQYMINA